MVGVPFPHNVYITWDKKVSANDLYTMYELFEIHVLSL